MTVVMETVERAMEGSARVVQVAATALAALACSLQRRKAHESEAFPVQSQDPSLQCNSSRMGEVCHFERSRLNQR